MLMHKNMAPKVVQAQQLNNNHYNTLSAVLINLLLSPGDFFPVVGRVCPLARDGDLLV